MQQEFAPYAAQGRLLAANNGRIGISAQINAFSNRISLSETSGLRTASTGSNTFAQRVPMAARDVCKAILRRSGQSATAAISPKIAPEADKFPMWYFLRGYSTEAQAGPYVLFL